MRCGNYGHLKTDGKPCTKPLSRGKTWCGQCGGRKRRIAEPPTVDPPINPSAKDGDRTPRVDLVLWAVGAVLFVIVFFFFALLWWIFATVVSFIDLLLLGWLENRRRRRRRLDSAR